MDLIKEFHEDTIKNVLKSHGLTLAEAFDICLHHKSGEDVAEEKELFVQKVHGKYRIRKSVKGKLTTFGYYNTLDDAVTIRDALIEDGWRLYRLPKICKLLDVELVK